MSEPSFADSLDRLKESFLLAAAQGGNTQDCESLLSIGADVNWVNPDGDSPLLAACRRGHADTVAMLLAHGANSNFAGRDSYAPIHICARRGDVTILNTLLGSNVSTTKKNKDGQTALDIAHSKGHEDVYSVLMGTRRFVGRAATIADPHQPSIVTNNHTSTAAVSPNAAQEIRHSLPILVAGENRERSQHHRGVNASSVISNADSASTLPVSRGPVATRDSDGSDAGRGNGSSTVQPQHRRAAQSTRSTSNDSSSGSSDTRHSQSIEEGAAVGVHANGVPRRRNSGVNRILQHIQQSSGAGPTIGNDTETRPFNSHSFSETALSVNGQQQQLSPRYESLIEARRSADSLVSAASSADLSIPWRAAGGASTAATSSSGATTTTTTFATPAGNGYLRDLESLANDRGNVGNYIGFGALTDAASAEGRTGEARTNLNRGIDMRQGSGREIDGRRGGAAGSGGSGGGSGQYSIICGSISGSSTSKGAAGSGLGGNSSSSSNQDHHHHPGSGTGDGGSTINSTGRTREKESGGGAEDAALIALRKMLDEERSVRKTMTKQLFVLKEQNSELVTELKSLSSESKEQQKDREKLESELMKYKGDRDALRRINLDQCIALEKDMKTALEAIERRKSVLISEQIESQKEERLCVVCQENNKSVVLLPCRHLCLCDVCAKHGQLTMCPLCRQEIAHTISVFS